MAQLGRRSTILTIAWMLGGCSTWEPGPAYSPPRVEMFTDDMISDGPRWSGIGFAQCQPSGFVVGLSHLHAPPPPGEHGWRYLDNAERDAVIRALEEGMSLIRVRDGARVPVHLREGCVSVSGEEHLLLDGDALFRALVPREPLEDGWYVFRVDLAPLRATGFAFEHDDSLDHRTGERAVDDVLYARVRWGSQPSWARVAFTRGSPRWTLAAVLSEASPGSALPSIEVRQDGEPLACVDVHDTGGGYGVAVECPSGELGLPPRGTTVELTLHGTDIRRPSGAPAGALTIPYDELFHPNDSSTAVLFEPNFAMDLIRDGAS